MKAIILDDDPLIVSFLAHGFHRRGYEVVTYSTPAECPLYLAESCPCHTEDFCRSVIISDFDMPIVNGVQFIEALRGKSCKCPHIALMSGFSMPREAVERAARWNVRFFAMPFHWSQIKDWLNQIEPSLHQE